MLSIPLLVILFLSQAQILHADQEFPALSRYIDMNWGGVKITSQLDARQTVSFNGGVPHFVYCGPFKNGGRDGRCQISYSYRVSFSQPETILGLYSITARFVHSLNDSYSCMAFENRIPDFVKLYSNTVVNNGDFHITYLCQSTSAEANTVNKTMVFFLLGAAATFFIAIGVVVGIQVGKKKKSEESLQENAAGAYGVFGTHNNNQMY